MNYRILRHYFNDDRVEVIERDLTLKQAQAHCSDPETSSSTCTQPTGLDRTARRGEWFDGYTSMTPADER